LGIFFISPLTAEAGQSIRVLILRDVSRCTISGRELTVRNAKTGQIVLKKRNATSLNFERKGNRIWVKGGRAAAPALSISSPGPLRMNGRQYRDHMRLLPGGNGGLLAVNELSLEDYLTGVLNSEISSLWPLEAVKAQAVAARTYAVYQKKNRAGGLYDVEAGVNDQVYGGMDREDARARQAVRETEGEFLVYGGGPIFAVYHSCCGGRTESSESLWAGNFPYLKSRECNYCMDSPHFLWNLEVRGDDLRKALGNGFVGSSRVQEIEIVERSEGRRVLQLLVQDEDRRTGILGKDFRRLLGYDSLRSTNFIVQSTGDSFIFSGLGWGHGVGLCQWGAKGMAEAGMDYREILTHYYQDVEVRKLRP
jgi:stage II sporulation protein D